MNDKIYLATLEARGDDEACTAARELLAWVPPHFGPIVWGGQATGRGKVRVAVRGRPVTLFSFRVTGDVSFDFPQLIRSTPFADPSFLRQLRARLNRLPSSAFTDDEVTRWMNTYRLKFLADPMAMKDFQETWLWVRDVCSGAAATGRPRA